MALGQAGAVDHGLSWQGDSGQAARNALLGGVHEHPAFGVGEVSVGVIGCLPEVDAVEVTSLSIQQMDALAAAMPDRYRVGVHLQAALGLRVSELLALAVEDFAFLAKPCRVKIRRQLARDGRSFVAPKTPHSVREVRLTEDVKAMLAEHLRRFPPNVDGLILTTVYGNPVTQKVYGENFRKAVANVEGVVGDTTPHDLRHHAASALVAEGVAYHLVACFLGHKNATMIRTTYRRYLPDADAVIGRALEAIRSRNVSQDVSQAPVSAVGNGA